MGELWVIIADFDWFWCFCHVFCTGYVVCNTL